MNGTTKAGAPTTNECVLWMGKVEGRHEDENLSKNVVFNEGEEGDYKEARRLAQPLRL